MYVSGDGAAQCDINVLILLRTAQERNGYVGYIPDDQENLVNRIRMFSQQHHEEVDKVSKKAGGPASQ